MSTYGQNLSVVDGISYHLKFTTHSCRYRIDSLALFAIPAEGPHGFFALGKITEASLRSVNNLLERFHASAFLYILTAPRKFVPLANYIGAPLLAGVSITLKGISSWIDCFKSSSVTAAPSFLPALWLTGSTMGYGWLVRTFMKTSSGQDAVVGFTFMPASSVVSHIRYSLAQQFSSFCLQLSSSV